MYVINFCYWYLLIKSEGHSIDLLNTEMKLCNYGWEFQLVCYAEIEVNPFVTPLSVLFR